MIHFATQKIGRPLYRVKSGSIRSVANNMAGLHNATSINFFSDIIYASKKDFLQQV
jgi:hypothetical protein